MATNNEIISAKLIQYKKYIKNNSFADARNRYQELEPLIASPNISMTDKLIYKINLLKATKAIILNHEPEDVPLRYNLFQRQIPILDGYLKFYWHRIDEEFLSIISSSLVNKMNEVADSIILAISEGFKLHSESKINNVVHIAEDGSITPAYTKCLSDINQSIAEGKEQLETILPLFSIWGSRGEEIGKEVKGSRKTIEKKLKETEEKIKIVEQIGQEQLLDFESKYFEKTAEEHEEKCKLFLWFAFGLGGATVVWGVLSQFLFARQYGFCGYYKSFNFVLCWLSNTHVRDLLVGGVLAAGIVACLRAYFANAHGASISRHRFNSLQIYSRGRKLIDAEDRAVFVQKATEAIFEHVPTGFTKYHKEDSKSSDNSAQLATLLTAALATTKVVTKGDGS